MLCIEITNIAFTSLNTLGSLVYRRKFQVHVTREMYELIQKTKKNTGNSCPLANRPGFSGSIARHAIKKARSRSGRTLLSITIHIHIYN